MAEQNKIILDADVKPLRKQLREATQELQLARQRYGEFSDEAVKAAQNVAGIRDQIDAANEAAQLFDPGKRFQALTTAASTAAGGIAAVQGAMALFGGESEEVEKALLKVQGAMALSQGLSQLKDVGKVGEQLKITFRGVTAGMSNFRKALIATGVGALVAGLGLLIANFETVQKVLTNMFPSLGKFASFIGRMVTAVTDFVGITNEAERSLENLAKANARSNEDIEARIKLLTAQGGKETEIYDLRKKQTNDELTLLRQTLKTKGELTDEELKRFRELKNTQIIEEVQFNRQQEEAAQAAAEKKAAADEKAKAAQDKIDAEKKAADQKIIDEKKALDEKTAAEDIEFQKRLNDILVESRLAAIEDENERARQTLLAQQQQELADLAVDTKIREDQKLAIQKQLEIRNKQELDALEQTFAEADAIKEIERLDEQMIKDQADFDTQRILLNEKQNLLDEYYKAGLISDDQYTAGTEANSKARIEIDKIEQQAKFQNAQIAAQLLGTVSDLVGKNTAAGKATAIAATTIDTYLGAQKAFTSQLIPGDPSSPIRAAIAAAIAVAGGIKNVRAIARTPVPNGGASASAPNITASAPAITSAVPTIGTSPVTALGTMMQNQPPLRAYVVESEVTGTQKRVADIERRAGF
jgi:hypothetical protein